MPLIHEFPNNKEFCWSTKYTFVCVKDLNALFVPKFVML